MPSARPTLQARPREVTGKAVARLRRAGQLPGVVYGRGVPSENVQVDAHEFELLRRHSTGNTLIDLTLDGTKPRPVLVYDVQVHPVTQRSLHVDLFLVRMTEELIVDVPLAATGVSPAIDNLNGVLLHALDHVRVRALPDHLPESISYSIESLADFDSAIHVRDLTIPSDVTLLNEPDELVAKVERPRVEVEEAPAAAEGEEEAEGEAAEGQAETGAGAGESDESAGEAPAG
jgi:large subunit ribosomal protein L25